MWLCKLVQNMICGIFLDYRNMERRSPLTIIMFKDVNLQKLGRSRTLGMLLEVCTYGSVVESF
jgi:hypothetical protein